ncbi:energy-coupling factor transporter transmembrane protein EcfT [Acholeplasma sp. OttesenSCG-928-E16]|nr:energy-coupling factor transporter transmembrane protein EcfT [Acholeplasma sp. OttesenSCG-928-E16]
MLDNITIGQYIPGNSWLHKLDPRIKIVVLILGIVATFIIPIPTNLEGKNIISVIAMLTLLALLLICIITAKIPLRKVLRGLRGLTFLLIFMSIIQIFTIKTGTELFNRVLNWSFFSILAMVGVLFLYLFTKKYIKFKTIYLLMAVTGIFICPMFIDYMSFAKMDMIVYSDGLIRAGFLFVRVLTVVIMTSILTFTTTTTDLNFGIETLLKPLRYIKIPVDTIAMLLSLTLRFIPTLIGETNKIMKAQASRGVDFKESKLKDKVIQIISLLIPILVVSINQAEDLAQAMEVRGYIISEKRTRIDDFKLGVKDFIGLFVGLLILGACIYLAVII